MVYIHPPQAPRVLHYAWEHLVLILRLSSPQQHRDTQGESFIQHEGKKNSRHKLSARAQNGNIFKLSCVFLCTEIWWRQRAVHTRLSHDTNSLPHATFCCLYNPVSQHRHVVVHPPVTSPPTPGPHPHSPPPSPILIRRPVWWLTLQLSCRSGAVALFHLPSEKKKTTNSIWFFAATVGRLTLHHVRRRLSGLAGSLLSACCFPDRVWGVDETPGGPKPGRLSSAAHRQATQEAKNQFCSIELV